MGKLFGTDGIRDLANRGPLTPAVLVRIGGAIGTLLLEQGRKDGLTVLMGEDGRASGQMIRFALSAGLLGRGIHVVNGGLLPTPALAYLTTRRSFTAGVMISASHNPAEHNGIKLFGRDGAKLPDELEDRIEALLEAQEPAPPPEAPGTAKRDESVVETYRRFLTEEQVPDLFLGSFRIVLDCANGAASVVAPEVLRALGAQLHACNFQPDGTNINRKCGSTHASLLSPLVRGEKADLAICLDGDGDRCILIDENGAVVDGDRLLLLLARHLREEGRLRDGRVVCTVMSNLGLIKALEADGFEVHTCAVGDRSVTRCMREKEAVLGGEQSGHIVCAENGLLIGDGLRTALLALHAMKKAGASLAELTAGLRAYPQVLLNVPVREKPDLSTLPAVRAAQNRAELELGTEGRVLVRYSGTEMLARVMLEGPEEGRIRELAKGIADALRSAIG